MKINFDNVPAYIRAEIDYPGNVIKKGDRHRAVRQIQQWLNFHNCRTGIDQDYGPATEMCVKAFQQQTAITPSG